ncbi:MAG TPA: hypothetical protein VIQ05_09955 [Tardiphaga sp.]
MNIKHRVFLSWVHETTRRPKRKSQKSGSLVQDGETLSAPSAKSASGDPAESSRILALAFKMASILPMVAGMTRATGTLPVIVQPPECCWTLS